MGGVGLCAHALLMAFVACIAKLMHVKSFCLAAEYDFSTECDHQCTCSVICAKSSLVEHSNGSLI